MKLSVADRKWPSLSADDFVGVSVQILKEEVHDLLDPSPPPTVRADMANGGAFAESKYSAKPVVPGKPPIQIRETTSGGITLAGVTETDVKCLEEMALCLEQGSLCRATGSTMMNTRSRFVDIYSAARSSKQ